MTTSVIETEYGPVECSVVGAGPPVLYFHGSGVTADVMADIESPLAEAGFRLILPNRPGYGRTPLAAHRTAADCAKVFAALLEALDIGEVSVMGSSGGAALAVPFVVSNADRVRSLVLLCPQLHRWDHKRWLPATSRWTLPFVKRRLSRKVLVRLYRMLLPRMSVEEFLKTEAGDRFADVCHDTAARDLAKTALAAMVEGTRGPGFENDFAAFTGEEILGPNDAIRTPTLVLHDPSDPLAPVEHVNWFVSRVPNCERVSLHTAGHLVWAGPDAGRMHTTRLRFLKEHAGGGSDALHQTLNT